MRELIMLLHLCAAGVCTPADQARLDVAFANCREAESVTACLGMPRNAEPTTTILRGQTKK